MSPRGRVAAPAGAAIVSAAALLAPATASAHGLSQRADLPIPEWLFAWAAAIVLVASFAALAALWPTPRLQEDRFRALAAGSAVTSRPVEVLAGLAGVALLVVTIWSGLAGSQGAQDNFAPTFVYVIFWVGLVFASLLLGDVFRALSPWRAIARATGGLVTRVRGGRAPAHRPYPERLGRWPAALALLVFTWTELVGRWGDAPEKIAVGALLYSAVTLAGMAVYGADRWHERGEGFAVYFNLFSRLSVLEVRAGRLGVRPLLGGLPRLDTVPGTVAVVAVMIGTVTFDGLSQGPLWRDTLQPALHDAFTGVGVGIETATTLADTVGLVAGPLLVGGFYALGISGAESVGGGLSAERLRRAFVHSLVPIALVYAMAHYFTALVFQGQAIGYLASDPLGRGWDLFGTAAAAIDYSVIGQNLTWYLQVGFVIAGHVAALVLAHDRALALYGDPRQAVRSQYWMLGIMVGFTSLALWLLASLNN
jgi:hypothetical protein